MRPAVEGALAHLRKHLEARPGRRGIFVLASDGAPSASPCSNNTIAAVAQVIASARMAALNSILTYVIGIATPAVGTERTDLETLATAGGTGSPSSSRPTANLASGSRRP